MRILIVMTCVCVALSGLWAVGELHRHDCASEGRVSCSVLPWVNGHYEAPVVVVEPRATPTPDALWNKVKP